MSVLLVMFENITDYNYMHQYFTTLNNIMVNTNAAVGSVSALLRILSFSSVQHLNDVKRIKQTVYVT